MTNSSSDDPHGHFADRLAAAVRRYGNPVVVGLDPRYEQLPEAMRASGGNASFADRAAACARFSRGVIDSSHLIYFLSVVVAALFLTYLSLQTRRWRA